MYAIMFSSWQGQDEGYLSELLPVVCKSLDGAQIAAQTHHDQQRDDEQMVRLPLRWVEGNHPGEHRGDVETGNDIYVIQACEEFA